MSVEEFNSAHEYLLDLVGQYSTLDSEDFVPVATTLVNSIKESNELRTIVFEKTNWMSLIKSLPRIFGNIGSAQELSSFYIRLVNAVLLYCRIIVCVESSDVLNQNALADLYELPKCLIDAQNVLRNDELKDGIATRIIEALAMVTQLLPNYQLGLDLNLSLGLDTDMNVQKDVSQIITFLEYSVNLLKRRKSDDLMLLMFFNNIISKNDNFLQYALKDETFRDIILEKYFLIDILNNEVYNSIIIKEDTSGNIEELLNRRELTALQTLKKILTHESITPYFESKLKGNSDETFAYNYNIILNWSRISSILLCSSAIFDTFQLTNIMIWVFMILENVSASIIKLFENHKINTTSELSIDQDLIPKTDFYYEILVNLLDILSHLCQFEHCQKFTLHYKGIEKLAKLLGTLHVNCYKLSVHIDDKKGGKLTLNDNLKKNTDYNNWLKVIDKENNKIKSINFPHTKSLIIEILTKFLVLDKESDENLTKLKDLQNLLKAESVLEIVLSNCAIDDNEPFIKERSIMFLKYALYKNQENQEFVAKLEQRTAVDSQSETLLEEVGYEVNISDSGKIGLKRKNTNSLG